jgi:hypothetical protein
LLSEANYLRQKATLGAHRRRGSGKTNTMAHPCRHLIVNGADSRRILLMTFSRRAARHDRTASPGW